MSFVSPTVLYPTYDELDTFTFWCLSLFYKVNAIAVTIRFLDPSIFVRLIAQPNLQSTKSPAKCTLPTFFEPIDCRPNNRASIHSLYHEIYSFSCRTDASDGDVRHRRFKCLPFFG